MYMYFDLNYYKVHSRSTYHKSVQVAIIGRSTDICTSTGWSGPALFQPYLQTKN